MKRTYIEPNVKVVNLENDQSVLHVCKIGGEYFSGTINCAYPGTGGPAASCSMTIKGTQNFTVFPRYEYHLPAS